MEGREERAGIPSPQQEVVMLWSASYHHMRINVVAALVSLTTKYSLENVKLTRDTYMRGLLQCSGGSSNIVEEIRKAA